MTPALKRRILAIWTDEGFRGTREDAMQLAMGGNDLFGNAGFEMAEPTRPEIIPDHPDQMYLELT